MLRGLQVNEELERERLVAEEEERRRREAIEQQKVELRKLEEQRHHMEEAAKSKQEQEEQAEAQRRFQELQVSCIYSVLMPQGISHRCTFTLQAKMREAEERRRQEVAAEKERRLAKTHAAASRPKLAFKLG